MKELTLIVSLLFPLTVYADIITLKDGTRIEGVVEGEMDGMALVKTKYGALNINKADIASQAPSEPAPATLSGTAVSPAPSLQEALIASTTPAANVSTAPAVVEDLPAAPEPEPKYTFKTLTLSTSAFQKLYFENETIIATETYASGGALLGLQGAVKDGAYREYYDNGNLKTEKTVINSRTSGALRAYYPGGTLQSEAYYLDGALNGTVRIYNESGKPLFEQNFRAGVPNGWFREFSASGELKSELFYTDGRVAEKPKAAEVKKPEAAAVPEEPESMVTVKANSLARGERFTFFLNNKYIARLTLDKGLNLISKDGKVPDGDVKVYNRDGKLEKEFLFEKNEVVLLKIYGENGALKSEYTFNKKGEAAKK